MNGDGGRHCAPRWQAPSEPALPLHLSPPTRRHAAARTANAQLPKAANRCKGQCNASADAVGASARLEGRTCKDKRLLEDEAGAAPPEDHAPADATHMVAQGCRQAQRQRDD